MVSAATEKSQEKPKGGRGSKRKKEEGQAGGMHNADGVGGEGGGHDFKKCLTD